MYTEVIKGNYARGGELTVAVLTGLIITATLQVSIRLFSELTPAEVVKPELVVNWLTLRQKTTIKKSENVKPLKPLQKVVERDVKQKRKSLPTKQKKNEYSALAKNITEKPVITKREVIAKSEEPEKQVVESETMPVPVPVFKLTEAPRFLHKEELVYPESMRALGSSGVVKVSVLIDKYGEVREVIIVQSAGSTFDRQAEKALMASSFFAAKVKEKSVASILKLSIKFNLL